MNAMAGMGKEVSLLFGGLARFMGPRVWGSVPFWAGIQGPKGEGTAVFGKATHGICAALAAILLAQATAMANDVCERWDSLQRAIREGAIEKDQAMEAMRLLTRVLLDTYRARVPEGRPRFPVKGYTARDIGGNNGSGFKPKGFDFYDGNRHKGHPAHDIFIRDKDQDGICDDTGQPAEICSFTGGVVVGVNMGWEPGSDIRGGNYVWIFDPHAERYYYYAHLDDVFVKIGDVVGAGEVIATLGRSGKNAWPRRSPTHLHFMCLSFDGGRMKPCDPYRALVEPSQ